MTISKARKYCLLIPILFMLGVSNTFAQVDSTYNLPQFDSQLLRLKVPEAFQRNSLKLEIFSDSSWQIYRGDVALNITEALEILGEPDKITEYEAHREKEDEFLREYRSRRVFSSVTAVASMSYLYFIWDKGWLYQIPGYAAIAVATYRMVESRRAEVQVLREQYFIKNLMSPSDVRQRVDDYNFQLYQFLSTAGIQFSDS